MKNELRKRMTSVLMVFLLMISTFEGIEALAEREYAADVTINGVAVAFKNEPYSKFDMVYVPLMEFCGYLNLDVVEENGEYTIDRIGSTVKFQNENVVVRVNGTNKVMNTSLTDHGGVIYAPMELFSTGFNVPVEYSKSFRQAEIKPNVYTFYIDAQHAAGLSAEVPDKDTLMMGEADYDSLHYKPSEYPELEKSLLYMLDFNPYKELEIEKVVLTVKNAMNSNYDPMLGFVKTELWEKGKVSYNSSPAEISDKRIASKVMPVGSYKVGSSKPWLDMSFDISSLAAEAMAEGGRLSLKVLGEPSKNNKNPTSIQVHVKGVNTPDAPFVRITAKENYSFEVKRVEQETDIERNTFEKLKFLTKLGIFKEGEEFPADLSSGVTRREFVAYAIRLMNDFSYNENAPQVFSDVLPGDACYGEIMDSAEIGLISSGAGIAFRPDENITYNEALTVIGRMLGYGTYAEKNGGFSQGFVSAAVRNDLLDSVKSHSGMLGFDSMFNLFFNALKSPMFEAGIYRSNGNVEYTFDENTTLLSLFWNLKKVEGIVEGNEYTNLDPDKTGTSGKLIIDSNPYAITDAQYNSLLGYKVKGYYDKENTILYLGAEKQKNNADIIDLHSITLVNAPKNGVLTYSYENENGKLETEDISSADVIIYNGKSIKFSDLRKEYLEKGAGSIVYLNDSTVIITAYTTVVVYDVDEEEEVITDKYAPYDNTLRLKNTDYYEFRDERGTITDIENLALYDVISAAVSIDKKLITGVVSKTKIIGTVSSFTDDGKLEVEVNGNLYETIGTNLSWLNELKKLGVQGTLFLDIHGFVAGFETAKASENLFGYVLTHGKKGGGISSKLQLGIITTANENMVAYDLADSVVIDGKKCRTEAEFLEAMNKENDVSGGGVTPATVKKQGIVFSTNSDGEITKIDTPYTNPDKENVESSMQLRYKGTKKLNYKAAGRLEDLFYWNMETSLNVLVPKDETLLDEYQYFRTGLKNDGDYQAEVFSVGKEHPLADIVVIRGATVSAGLEGIIAVAGKRVFALNEDGDYDEKLYYYTASDEASSVIVPSDFYTNPYNKNDEADSYNERADYITALKNLNPGDVIRIGRDFNGNLTAIKRYYDCENGVYLDLNDKYNDELRIYGGYVTNKYNSYVRFTPDRNILADPETFKNASEDNFYWIDLKMNGDYNKVFTYEVEGSNVVMQHATEADVVDYKHVPYAPSGLILQVRYSGTINAAYIVNVEKPDNTGIYKVTFDPGEDASGTMATKQVDSTVELPKNGFLHNDREWGFDCWIYNGQRYNPGETISVTSDAIVTAKWKWVGIQHDIVYVGNGADSGSVQGNRALEGASFALAENPADTGFKKSGCKFAGWEYDGQTYKPGTTFTMPNPGQKLVFEAKWVECWDGSKKEVTPENGVYKISNGAELAWFADFVNKGNTTENAELTGDIILNLENEYETEWTAIGNKKNPYAGTFDGKGYTVKGLYNKSGSDQNTGGLFGYIGTDGKVQKVKIAYGKLVSQYTNSNGIAGIAMIAAQVSGGTISECIAEGTISNDGEGTFINGCAGIVAEVIHGRVEKCISRVNIISDSNETVSTQSGDNLGIGGIASRVRGSAVLYQCGNEGTINAPKYSRVAGIAGAQLKLNDTLPEVNQCYNTGNITAGTYVAGIVGYTGSNVTIKQSNYNRGNIRVEFANGVGAGLWVTAYRANEGGSYTTGIVDFPNAIDDTTKVTSGLAYAPKNGSKKEFKNYIYIIPVNNPSTALSHPIDKDTAGNTYKKEGVDMTGNTDMSAWLTKLNGWENAVIYTTDESINGGYPIFTWQK